MPETDELRIFEADPKRVVSVTAKELQSLVTLGRETVRERTCHLDMSSADGITCNSCGIRFTNYMVAFDDVFGSGYARTQPKYCPNCGARVVSGNE